MITEARYATIQEAVGDAGTNETVHVYPGTYQGNIHITAKELTLKAVDENGEVIDAKEHNENPLVSIDGRNGGPVINITMDDLGDILIEGFHIFNQQWGAISLWPDPLVNTSVRAINNHIIADNPETAGAGSAPIQLTGVGSSAIGNLIETEDPWLSAAILVFSASDIDVKENIIKGAGNGDIGISVQSYNDGGKTDSGKNGERSLDEPPLPLIYSDTPRNGGHNGASTYDIRIEDNTIIGSDWAILATTVSDDIGELTISGNIVSDSYVGLSLSDWDNRTIELVKAENNEFENNDFQVSLWTDGLLVTDLEDILADNTFDRAVVVRDNPIKVPTIFSFIQSGINAAEDGDVVEVAAGTYHEAVEINVPNLTLESGEGRDVTIIENPNVGSETAGVNVLKDMGTVTVEGFTVNNFRNGIMQPITATGTVFIVKYNKVIPENENYMRNGIQISGNGSQAIGNYIVGAPLTADWAGSAINVVDAKSALVKDNVVNTASADIGIAVLNWNDVDVQNITIEDNKITGANNGIRIDGHHSADPYYEIKNITITGNEIKDGDRGVNAQWVKLSNISITNNIILDNDRAGIRFSPTSAEVIEGVSVNNNSIVGNNPSVELGVGSVDATCNWWGTDDYSTILTKISGEATIIPFLVDGEDDDPETPGFQPVEPNPCSEDPIAITSVFVTDEICGALGSIEIEFEDGFGQIDIVWTGGSDTNISSPYIIDELDAGTYDITITAEGSQAVETGIEVEYLPVTNISTTPYQHYATISEAVTAASSGDILELCAGDYTETVNISKDLIIIGPNVGNDPNDATPRDPEAVLLDGKLLLPVQIR